ncbi:MAG: T9SS type A sorting domain-containing protein [bacterium]|nr:MAG: T9SS type A sorting domain-containing protein [bacterium]
MKKSRILIVFLMLILSASLFSQSVGDYRTRNSGDWSTAAIWEIYNGSSWVPVGSPPNGSETITVLAADSVFVNLPVTISDTLINQGIVDAADSLTITVGNGGVYQHNRDAGKVPKCIWDVGSTIYITAVTSTAPDDRAQNYYHMVFYTPDQISNLNMGLDDNTVGGDIRVIDTGIARWYLTTALAQDTSIVRINGDVFVEAGTFSVQGTSNAQTTFIVNHYGNIIVTGGNFSISRGSQGGGTTTWYLHEGDFSMSDAASNNSTALAGGAKFVFAKPAGTQTLSLSNITYNSNAIPFEVSSTTTLDVGSGPIQGTGIFILNEDAGLITAHAGGVAGSIQTGGAITLSHNASFTFNGAVAQVTSASMPDTVMDLTINNAAGVALSQPTLINGVLRLVSGVFDNTIPFTLGPNGSISYEGGGLLVGIVSNDLNVPESFFVDQNYPNPFNPTTTIRFGLPAAADVAVKVFNLLGQEVANLFDDRLAAGVHELQFDAGNLSSGIYFYRIQAGQDLSLKRMFLLK